MIEALYFSKEDEKAQAFSICLDRLSFPYRLSEHKGGLMLWVYEPDHQEVVKRLFAQFEQQPFLNEVNTVSVVRKVPWWRFPVSLMIVLASVLGFWVVAFDHLSWLNYLSFQGFDLTSNKLLVNDSDKIKALLLQGEWWRIWTPMFLHFDLMHVVFNITIFWFLGSQLEKIQGSVFLLGFIVVVAAASNMAQFGYSPHRLFGGMSGVNYGLLAYVFVLLKCSRKRAFSLPQGFFIVSVIMMMLGFFDVFLLFGYAIANWAHLSGFLAGVLMALLILIVDRFPFKKAF